MKKSNTFNHMMASLVWIILGASHVALANTSSEVEGIRITVAFADLNLANEAGVQVLYGRLKRAARDVCGETSLQIIGSVSGTQKVRECYRDTLTKAVEEIDNDLLSRIHAS